MTRKRYAQVGTGTRAGMFSGAILGEFNETAALVGLCDSNPGRLAVGLSKAHQRDRSVRGYLADDFEQMVMETNPDIVIVTTIDATHDAYICRAMELGCDVITEKPMTMTAEKCQRIIDTRRKTGRSCRVTFNYRYSPPRTQVKDLLMKGVIGDILSVDFHWMLDTHHGADYFRRWHRYKRNSGGLMVHKATHHFDLVNWWLETVPAAVFASGQRRFYVPEQAAQYDLDNPGDRCLTCAEAGKCPFFLDLRAYPTLKSLFLDNEQYDGYFRDRCIFSDDIEIEDSMNVIVDYANGVKMSYSLNAFMPGEGYTIVFNGTRGRLEHQMVESSYISGDRRVPGEMEVEPTSIRICPHFADAYEVDVWQGTGGHGGGDTLLLQDLFDPDEERDYYKRAADHRAGAYAALTGIAANRSMALSRQVMVDSLVHDLEQPF